MSRNKLIAAVLLGLTLAAPALAESENLISEEMIAKNTVNYKTETAIIGSYQQIFNNSGEEYYPYACEVYSELDGVRFVEHTVEKGDAVKKGDVLARFEVELDEVRIAEQKIILENAVSTLARETEDREEEIVALKEQLLKETDRFEYEILELRIRRAKIELEQYITNQERLIEETEETIAELEKHRDGYEVLAPMDGIVARVGYFRPGEAVFQNEPLAALYRPDVKLIQMENGGGNMHYGMEVILEYGHGDKARYATGHVVGSDLLIPEGQRTGKVYVAVDDEADKTDYRKLKFAGRYLENVLIVPSKAVKMEAGKYYVTKLVDGVAQKRYINCAAKQGDYAWVLQGLEAGDEVIVG